MEKGRHFHSSCFTCKTCKRPLNDKLQVSPSRCPDWKYWSPLRCSWGRTRRSTAGTAHLAQPQPRRARTQVFSRGAAMMPAHDVEAGSLRPRWWGRRSCSFTRPASPASSVRSRSTIRACTLTRSQDEMCRKSVAGSAKTLLKMSHFDIVPLTTSRDIWRYCSKMLTLNSQTHTQEGEIFCRTCYLQLFFSSRWVLTRFARSWSFWGHFWPKPYHEPFKITLRFKRSIRNGFRSKKKHNI